VAARQPIRMWRPFCWFCRTSPRRALHSHCQGFSVAMCRTPAHKLRHSCGSEPIVMVNSTLWVRCELPEGPSDWLHRPASCQHVKPSMPATVTSSGPDPTAAAFCCAIGTHSTRGALSRAPWLLLLSISSRKLRPDVRAELPVDLHRAEALWALDGLQRTYTGIDTTSTECPGGTTGSWRQGGPVIH
jgi:hypothetical protein